MARPSGRSEASRPASPKRSRTGLAGQAVEVDPEAGGGERLEALGEQRADRAGQDVAGAAGREGRVLERGDGDRRRRARRSPSGRPSGRRPGPSVAAASRAAADARVVVARRGRRRRAGVAAAPGSQPGELAGVRGQDGRPAVALPPVVHRGQRRGAPRRRARSARASVSPAPVEQRARTSSAVARPGRRPGPTTIASCSWSRIRASAGSGSTSSTSSSGRRHRRRLDDLGREQRLERLGDGERHQAGAGSTGGPADEQRGAGVVERAGDDEQLAERALVAARRALRAAARDDDRRRRASSPRPGTAHCHRTSAPGRRVAAPNPTGPRSGTGLGVAVGARGAARRLAARSRSIRARIRRSRSSRRSSMSSGKTYRPPAVRTPNAIATA